jgi:hypothetical protein
MSSFRIHQADPAINLHALVCHKIVEEEKVEKSAALTPADAVVPTIVEPEKAMHTPGPVDQKEEVVMRLKRRGAGTGKLNNP